VFVPQREQKICLRLHFVPQTESFSIECLTKDIISLWKCEDKVIQSRKWQRLLHKFVRRETKRVSHIAF